MLCWSSRSKRLGSRSKRRASRSKRGWARDRRGWARGQRGWAWGPRGWARGPRGWTRGRRGWARGQRGWTRGQRGWARGRPVSAGLEWGWSHDLRCDNRVFPILIRRTPIQQKLAILYFRVSLCLCLAELKISLQEAAKSSTNKYSYLLIAHNIIPLNYLADNSSYWAKIIII